MRKTLTTVALVLALTCPAWAGIIHIPPAAPPPEPTYTADGEIQNDITDTLTQIALTVLVSVLP